MARCACGRRRVLVVDDDADIRDSLAVLLTEEGCEVARAADGASALRHLRRDHACLVLLDLMMPGVSGWKFMATLLEDVNLAAIPVCVISAVNTHAPISSVGVLPKPLDLESVLAVIHAYCPSGGGAGPHFAHV